MSRLQWNAVGSRFYETGIDRGVLYPNGQPGVPWSGLTTVSESPTGGDPQPYYLDGVKYLERAATEEFGLTIEAWIYPDEFAQCDGSAMPFSGVFMGQQRRKKFGLAYRTRVGNDTDGTSKAYKIHMVYGLLAAPSKRSYATISDNPEPMGFSWDCSATPVAVGNGLKPTASITIDSRKIPAQVLQIVEDRLYGSTTQQAYLPSPTELFELFAANPGGVVAIQINTVTGLSLLQSQTPGDLSAIGTSGIFVLTADTRLTGGTDSGIYTLEE